MSFGNNQKMANMVWSNHVLSLFNSGDYSDLTIECQDSVFKVHKAIVCPQSPVLAAAVNGDFKEAKTNVVEIDAFGMETVESMVFFMYGKMTGYREEPAKNRQLQTPTRAATDVSANAGSGHYASLSEQQAQSKLLGLVQMNAIADYYDVSALRVHTNFEICALLGAHWSPVGFLEAAQAASTSTGDAELHHLFVELAVKNMESLQEHSDDFAGLVTMKDFAAEFMKHSCTRITALTKELEELILYRPVVTGITTKPRNGLNTCYERRVYDSSGDESPSNGFWG